MKEITEEQLNKLENIYIEFSNKVNNDFDEYGTDYNEGMIEGMKIILNMLKSF